MSRINIAILSSFSWKFSSLNWKIRFIIFLSLELGLGSLYLVWLGFDDLLMYCLLTTQIFNLLSKFFTSCEKIKSSISSSITKHISCSAKTSTILFNILSSNFKFDLEFLISTLKNVTSSMFGLLLSFISFVNWNKKENLFIGIKNAVLLIYFLLCMILLNRILLNK